MSSTTFLRNYWSVECILNLSSVKQTCPNARWKLSTFYNLFPRSSSYTHFKVPELEIIHSLSKLTSRPRNLLHVAWHPLPVCISLRSSIYTQVDQNVRISPSLEFKIKSYISIWNKINFKYLIKTKDNPFFQHYKFHIKWRRAWNYLYLLSP